MKNSHQHPAITSPNHGFTMVELLVVIAIIGILITMLVQGLGSALRTAEAAKNVSHMKQILNGTINWAADHGDRIPSPEYPGGEVVPSGQTEDDFFPDYWNVGDTGLWLDGVVFAALYLDTHDDGGTGNNSGGGSGGGSGSSNSGGGGSTGGYVFNSDGEHLKGTFFESSISVKKDPGEKDWHKHSYAMNKNLQYDRIHDTSGSSDPWLTEKTRSNLIHANNAMLYIDCSEENVVSYEERDLIIETLEKRWDGSKSIAAFLGGAVLRITEDEIPEDDPTTDRESSRFWRGVDPD